MPISFLYSITKLIKKCCELNCYLLHIFLARLCKHDLKTIKNIIHIFSLARELSCELPSLVDNMKPISNEDGSERNPVESCNSFIVNTSINAMQEGIKKIS